jgi:acetyl-CoA acetyltransferase
VNDASIVDAVRSPIGRRNGLLSMRGDELAGQVLNALVARHDLEARYGIATMCIGLGQALAGIVERL